MTRLHAGPALVTVLMALAFVQTLQILGGVTPILDGRLIDPDCYMRLDRVRMLWEGGAWYNSHSLRHNAPFGETLHWTRPLDLLLLPAYALGGERTLWWWGVAISPVFEVLALLALSFATRPFLTSGGFALLGILFVTQPGPAGVFVAGRPDHHGFLLLLMIAGLAPLLRRAAGDGDRRLPVLAGFVLGLGLWVAVEALAAYALAFAVLGVLWLWRGEDWLDALTSTAKAGAAMVAVALVLERRPADWLTASTDRLSIIHLTIALAGAGAAIALQQLDPRRRRPFWAALATGVSLTLLALLFPELFRPPLADLPLELGEVWLDDIMERMPLWPGDSEGWRRFVLHFGPMAIGIPYLLHGLRHGEIVTRRLALVQLIGLAVYLPAALHQVRFAPFAEALMVLPWTQAVLALGRRRLPVGLRALLTVLLLMGPSLAVTLIARSNRGHAPAPPFDTCPWSDIAPTLAGLPRPNGQLPLVFTTPYPGPELAYRAGVAVIATPYHGNAPAIVATMRALMGADDRALQGLLAERRADYLVLCRSSREGQWLDSLAGDNAHKRLMRGQAPPGFVPMALDSRLAGDFVLYKISGWPAP